MVDYLCKVIPVKVYNLKKTLALVLGSGGARGIAHIGVIRELIRHGYDISSISGSSMGALVGGVYASGKLDEFEAWLCSLDKMAVFNLVDFTLSMHGIIKADKVLKEIQKFIPDHNIEDLPIKYTAVATDVKKKTEVVITEGSLFEAIRASISIPLVITPMKKNDTLFLDGGMLNPIPVNRVVRKRKDILVAVDVSAHIPYKKSKPEGADSSYLERLTNGKLSSFKSKITSTFPENKKENIGYFKLISESTSMMLAQIAKLSLALNPPDMLIQVSRGACGTFDFYKAEELIELGRQATVEQLKKSKAF